MPPKMRIAMTEEMKKAQRKRLRLARKKRQLKEKRFWESIRRSNRIDVATQTPESFDMEFPQYMSEDVTFETLGELFDDSDTPDY